MYGRAGAAWVSETTECKALSATARRRLQAERAWQTVIAPLRNGCGDDDLSVTILRLAGIYGPGRSALHTLARRQLQVSSSSGGGRGDAKIGVGGNGDMSDDIVVSRVHVDDVVEAVMARLDVTKVGHNTTSIIPTVRSDGGNGNENNRDDNVCVINVSDDMPASRNTVFMHANELLLCCDSQRVARVVDIEESGREQGNNAITQARATQASSPSSSSSSSTSAISRRAREREQRRVCNGLMKRLLVPTLKYPTFREGLPDIAREEFGLVDEDGVTVSG